MECSSEKAYQFPRKASESLSTTSLVNVKFLRRFPLTHFPQESLSIWLHARRSSSPRGEATAQLDQCVSSNESSMQWVEDCISDLTRVESLDFIIYLRDILDLHWALRPRHVKAVKWPEPKSVWSLYANKIVAPLTFSWLPPIHGTFVTSVGRLRYVGPLLLSWSPLL